MAVESSQAAWPCSKEALLPNYHQLNSSTSVDVCWSVDVRWRVDVSWRGSVVLFSFWVYSEWGDDYLVLLEQFQCLLKFPLFPLTQAILGLGLLVSVRWYFLLFVG